MFPVNDEGDEIVGARDEATLVSMTESKVPQVSRQLNCDIYWWSYWEETRMIIIVSTENEQDYP